MTFRPIGTPYAEFEVGDTVEMFGTIHVVTRVTARGISYRPQTADDLLLDALRETNRLLAIIAERIS